MKCKKCDKKATLDIKRHKAAFCKEHLIEHLQNQVQKAIKKYHMCKPEDKLLIAVSGGKDSLALWDMLLDIGYQADGFYIDLGITSYSQLSLEKAETFAKSKGSQLFVVSLPQLYDQGVQAFTQKSTRSPCSACGMIKRYIMNLMARVGGYEAVVTGHNLDDEVATLMGNVLHWEVEYLARQFPSMPSRRTMAKKIKPLCRLTERETAAYALIKNIDYILEECPMSEGASSFKYKQILNDLEAKSPGTKDQFYLGYLREGQSYFREARKKLQIVDCPVCGEPTTRQDLNCSFCQLIQKNQLDPLKLKNHITQLFP